MDITYTEIIVWLIVGGLSGSLAAILVTRKKGGFGRYANLGIGLIGALIGGFLFDVIGIDTGLGNLLVTFDDLLAAFIGSLIFLTVLWYVLRHQKDNNSGSMGD